MPIKKVLSPEYWTPLEISLWILRILGSLLFIAWPVVFVAASMLVLGHLSSELNLIELSPSVGTTQ